ncbi:MAG: hypothetical protein K0S07_1429 [Chlamydiales bacterium]|jgi:hypothetical protein|nr:hypothetical protein [Chlamydiales bacterium]
MFQKIALFFVRFGDRLLGVFFVLLCCQLPTFIQQYTQRLGGHLEELGHFISRWRELAAFSEKNLPEYIASFVGSSNLDVSRQGQLMEESLTRFNELSTAYAALSNAGPFQKPLFFFRYLDPLVAKGTWQVFQPGLPSPMEIVVYAVLGLFLSSLLSNLIKGVLVQLFRKGRLFCQRSVSAVSSVSADQKVQ